jgi:hypothetical protein
MRKLVNILIKTKEQALARLGQALNFLMEETDLDGKKIAIELNKEFLNVMRISWVENDRVQDCYRRFIEWFNTNK